MEGKVKVCAGVDVSAATLEVAWRRSGGQLRRRSFANNRAGHEDLIRELRREKLPVLVALEATGMYGLDLAVALDRATDVSVMVANPRTIADFGKALLQRSKTDRVDAETILLFVERMPFVPWHAPSTRALELRAITRRIAALGKIVRAEKTRQHAADASETVGAILRQSAKNTVAVLEREIVALRNAARELIRSDGHLQRQLDLLMSIKGIGIVSAVQILAELALLPADMTNRQWVAHAGLDPRLVQSGTSLRLATHISKAGNHYLRAALYMPAMTAGRYNPQVMAFRAHLLGRGKRPKQVHVAVMRKLLHAIHAMLKTDAAFDGKKFYRLAAGAAGTSGIASSAISEVSATHSA